MIDTKLAVQSLYDFVNAFSNANKEGVLSSLHFPHSTHADGSDPRLFQNGEEYWEFLSYQIKQMRELEGWTHFTIDLAEIINIAPQTVQILVEFSRRRADGSAFGVGRGIWIATKKQDQWGMQVRSAFPKNGKVSFLGGQPNSEKNTT